MVLYHIGINPNPGGTFIPRVPFSRGQWENGEIRRICFSDSVNGCLTAMPEGGCKLRETVKETDGHFYLYVLDTDKYGIDKQDILTPAQLYENNYVWDAEETDEYWVLVPVKIEKEDIHRIQIVDWEEDTFDVIPYPAYSMAEEKYDGNYEKGYHEIFGEDETIEAGIVIENAWYNSLSTGETYVSSIKEII